LGQVSVPQAIADMAYNWEKWHINSCLINKTMTIQIYKNQYEKGWYIQITNPDKAFSMLSCIKPVLLQLWVGESPQPSSHSTVPPAEKH